MELFSNHVEAQVSVDTLQSANCKLQARSNSEFTSQSQDLAL